MTGLDSFLRKLVIICLLATIVLGELAYLDLIWFGYFVVMVPITLALELLRRV